MHHRNKKHNRRTRRKRGGSYGFGGSILGDAGGTGAGNALWNNMGGECGAPRIGNNVEMMGGRRRKRRTLRGGSSCRAAEGAGVEMMGGRRRSRRKQPRRRRSSRRSQRGGSEPAPFHSSGGSDPRMALHQPRAGYTFTGAGAGGIADAVPSPPGVTYV